MKFRSLLVNINAIWRITWGWWENFIPRKNGYETRDTLLLEIAICWQMLNALISSLIFVVLQILIFQILNVNWKVFNVIAEVRVIGSGTWSTGIVVHVSFYCQQHTCASGGWCIWLSIFMYLTLLVSAYGKRCANSSIYKDMLWILTHSYRWHLTMSLLHPQRGYIYLFCVQCLLRLNDNVRRFTFESPQSYVCALCVCVWIL